MLSWNLYNGGIYIYKCLGYIIALLMPKEKGIGERDGMEEFLSIEPRRTRTGVTGPTLFGNRCQ